MKRGGNGVVLLYYANPVSDPRWSQIWRVDRDLRQSIEDTESDYVKFDDRVIEGRLYTVRPYKLFDDTYRIEVLFNAAIVQP